MHVHIPTQAVAKLVDETKDSRRLVAGLDGWEAPLLDMLVAAENLEGTTFARDAARESQAAAGDEGPNQVSPSPAQQEPGGDLRPVDWHALKPASCRLQWLYAHCRQSKKRCRRRNAPEHAWGTAVHKRCCDAPG